MHPIRAQKAAPEIGTILKHPYAPYFVFAARKEGGSSPNPRLVCSSQSPKVQTKQKLENFMFFLIAGPRH